MVNTHDNAAQTNESTSNPERSAPEQSAADFGKIADATERGLVQKLGELFATEKRTQWQIGEIVNRLKQEYLYSTQRIIDCFPHLDLSRNRIDEIAKIERNITPDLRNNGGLDFADAKVAKKAPDKLIRAARDFAIPVDERAVCNEWIELARNVGPRSTSVSDRSTWTGWLLGAGRSRGRRSGGGCRGGLACGLHWGLRGGV